MDHHGMSARKKVVLYNPKAVFFTMPLGPLAVASHLDREKYDVVIVDGRLEDDPVAAVLGHLDGALCLGVSVLTGRPIQDALVARAAAHGWRSWGRRHCRCSARNA
jgi:hypothetical protein